MHQFDMSRLTRRKPDIKNATCLKYDWKPSSRSSWELSFYAHDYNKRFKYSHVGSLAVKQYSNGYTISLGHWTDWSGTIYDGYGNNSETVIDTYFETDSVQKAQAEAERLYGMYMVPLLLSEDDSTTFSEKMSAIMAVFPKMRG